MSAARDPSRVSSRASVPVAKPKHYALLTSVARMGQKRLAADYAQRVCIGGSVAGLV